MQYHKKVEYWNDLSKFAFLVQKIYQMLSTGEPPTIEQLIGEHPRYGIKNQADELSDTEIEWVQWANEKGLEVNRTGQGLTIRRAK